MKHYQLGIILLISIFCFSFSFHKEFSIDKLPTPPGTIKVSNNLYLDMTEGRNIDYCEFIHWTNKVFGMNSIESIKVLPDTTVWRSLGKSYEKFPEFYLRHPTFRNYPVVGISYSQAKSFAKWRSDRVMEFILIRDGIIKYNPAPTKDSLFTIANYFNRKYGKVSDDQQLQYYPVYSLPDSITFYRSLLFADSLINYALLHYKNKAVINLMISPNFNKNIAGKNDTLLNGKYQIRQIPDDFFGNRFFRSNYKYDLILDLKGNVAEMTSTEGTTFGGSYMDSNIDIDKKLFKKDTVPNCYTGFRNICSYKKWSSD